MLIFDAAYLFLGSKDLERKTQRKVVINDKTIAILLNYIEQKANGGDTISQRHYLTAERDSNAIQSHKPLYDSLKKQGIQVDIRKFKRKTTYCPNKSCPVSKSGFDIQVQQEVDVAIVMKAMKAVVANQLETLALVAGDGDFKDMIEFLTDTHHKKVAVFGWSANMSLTLSEKATPGHAFHLDDIWEQLSEPIQSSTYSVAQPAIP